MAAVIRTNVRRLLLALRDEVVLRTELDPTRVIITAMEESGVPHFGAQQDVLIRPLEDQPVQGVCEGSGRVDDRRRRSFRLTVRTNLYLDEAGADAARLTDQSLGHYRLEDLTYDALRCFDPTDDDGNSLVAGVGVTESVSGVKRESGDDNWVTSYMVVTFEYSRDLDQSRQ